MGLRVIALGYAVPTTDESSKESLYKQVRAGVASASVPRLYARGADGARIMLPYNAAGEAIGFGVDGRSGRSVRNYSTSFGSRTTRGTDQRHGPQPFAANRTLDRRHRR